MQESWKRAAQLSRARELDKQSGKPSGRDPRGPLERPGGRKVLLIILLLVLAAAIGAAWYYRGKWIPRSREKLPEPVAAVLKEPEVSIDWLALENGLDVNLILFNDYKALLSSTNEWQPGWELLDTGGGTLRVTAPGALVYVKGGGIENYELDIKRVFEEPAWEKWRPALSKAKLSPDLTWTALTGETEMPRGLKEYSWTSPESVRVDNGWLHREYLLHFLDGWLSIVEGRYKIGPASPAGGGESAAPAG